MSQGRSIRDLGPNQLKTESAQGSPFISLAQMMSGIRFNAA